MNIVELPPEILTLIIQEYISFPLQYALLFVRPLAPYVKAKKFSSVNVLAKTALAGYPALFRFVHHNFVDRKKRKTIGHETEHIIIRNAYCGGNRDIIAFLHQRNYEGFYDACAGSIQGGHLDLLMEKLIHEPQPDPIFRQAFFANSLDTLQYLDSQYPNWNRDDIIRESEVAILRDGSLDLFKWCYNRYHFASYRLAAKYGRRDILSFLTTTEGVSDDEHICANACAHGDLVFWLHDLGYPWGPATCAKAAKYNNLPLLQKLHEKGCAWDHRVTSHLAKHCNLTGLKWAHSQGCPFVGNAFVSVIEGISGDTKLALSILEYLRSIQCPSEYLAFWLRFSIAGLSPFSSGYMNTNLYVTRIPSC